MAAMWSHIGRRFVGHLHSFHGLFSSVLLKSKSILFLVSSINVFCLLVCFFNPILYQYLLPYWHLNQRGEEKGANFAPPC